MAQNDLIRTASSYTRAQPGSTKRLRFLFRPGVLRCARCPSAGPARRLLVSSRGPRGWVAVAAGVESGCAGRGPDAEGLWPPIWAVWVRGDFIRGVIEGGPSPSPFCGRAGRQSLGAREFCRPRGRRGLHGTLSRQPSTETMGHSFLFCKLGPYAAAGENAVAPTPSPSPSDKRSYFAT